MTFDIKKKSHFREEVTMVALFLDQNDVNIDFSDDEGSFDTPKTTEDSAAFNPDNPKKMYLFSDQELRGCKIPYFPNLVTVSSNTPELKIGENIGTRATATIRFEDFISNDTYELSYNYRHRRVVGSFWGKLIARNYIRNRKIVIYRGYQDDVFDINNFTAETYIIKDFKRNKDGGVSISCVDPLYYTNESKAKMPVKSAGVINTDYAETATSIDIFSENSPEEYGEVGDTGIIRVNEEYLLYLIENINTGTGIITMTVQRGVEGTTAEPLETGDNAQICYVASNKNVVDIIQDALSYTKIESQYIPALDWEHEKNTSLSVYNFTTILDKPTEVKKIISDLIRHSGAIMFWDTVESVIKLQGNPRFADPDLIVDENVYEQDSVSINDLLSEQVTRSAIYFAKRNYTLDNKEISYRKSFIYIDDLAESEARFDEVSEADTILSNWLTSSVEDTQTATELTRREVTRKSNIPFETVFTLDSEYIGEVKSLDSDSVNAFSLAFDQTQFSAPKRRLWLGSLVEMTNHLLIAKDGTFQTYRGQVTKLQPKGFDKWEVTILSISQELVTDFDYIIDTDYEDLVLTDVAAPISGRPTKVLINQGVTIGQTYTALAALRTGDYPDGLYLELDAAILGFGGNGGDVQEVNRFPEPGICEVAFATSGGAGGTALLIECNNVDISIGPRCSLYGGGGGGAGAIGYTLDGDSYQGKIGAGGQGYVGGLGGSRIGTSETGDDGSISGPGLQENAGGSWGEAGNSSSIYACGNPNSLISRSGGRAGYSVDTNGFTNINFVTGYNGAQVKGPIV